MRILHFLITVARRIQAAKQFVQFPFRKKVASDSLCRAAQRRVIKTPRTKPASRSHHIRIASRSPKNGWSSAANHASLILGLGWATPCGSNRGRSEEFASVVHSARGWVLERRRLFMLINIYSEIGHSDWMSIPPTAILDIWCALARSGSVRLATVKLRLSQNAASHKLKMLEMPLVVLVLHQEHWVALTP